VLEHLQQQHKRGAVFLELVGGQLEEIADLEVDVVRRQSVHSQALAGGAHEPLRQVDAPIVLEQPGADQRARHVAVAEADVEQPVALEQEVEDPRDTHVVVAAQIGGIARARKPLPGIHRLDASLRVLDLGAPAVHEQPLSRPGAQTLEERDLLPARLERAITHRGCDFVGVRPAGRRPSAGARRHRRPY
jgi:hypothetical protein